MTWYQTKALSRHQRTICLSSQPVYDDLAFTHVSIVGTMSILRRQIEQTMTTALNLTHQYQSDDIMTAREGCASLLRVWRCQHRYGRRTDGRWESPKFTNPFRVTSRLQVTQLELNLRRIEWANVTMTCLTPSPSTIPLSIHTTHHMNHHHDL